MAGTSTSRRRFHPTPAAALRSRLGFNLEIFSSLVLIAMTATVTAAAQHSQHGGPGPNTWDLAYHIACSEVAKTRVQTAEEAAACARAFMRVKLSFVPSVSLADYEALPPEKRAAVNLAGYRQFVVWSRDNAAWVKALRAAILPPPPVASN